MIGAPDGPLVSGARTSAQTYDLPYDELTAAELQERFPAFQPAPGMAALWEPRAGLLFPDRCISAHLDLARASGAELHTDEPVESWSADGDGVSVVTPRGHYRADCLILACGPWLPALIAGLRLPLDVERTVQHWFRAADHADRFLPPHFPIYLFEFARDLLFYGFPDTGDGVKVARHHQGILTTPDSLDRRVTAVEVDGMRELLAEYLPDANGTHLRSAVCMYTNTPDGAFVIDVHPDSARVILASPCSGHGFKFSSAVGEVLADLAAGKPTRVDLSPFSVGRFL